MNKNREYTALLKRQIAEIGKEVRFLEFKSNYQDADRLGKYISALSNGACLDNEEFGYLYFGVEDETLVLLGTTFDASRIKARGNQNLEIFRLADKQCEALLLESLKDHGSLTKKEIVRLLWDILPDQLDDKQKNTNIYNILRKLRESGKVINRTIGNKSLWSLAKT